MAINNKPARRCSGPLSEVEKHLVSEYIRDSSRTVDGLGSAEEELLAALAMALRRTTPSC